MLEIQGRMDYPFNAWYAAMWSKDLPRGQLVGKTYLGQPVVLYREPSGKPVAMADICPHRFAPLSRGELLPDGGVRCMYHGLEFAASGKCSLNPHGDGKIPPTMCVRTYPVTEKHTLVWIWMGKKEPTDTIPDFSVLDESSGLSTQRDSMTMAASYRLLADNLMDLSHASFLHEGILSHREGSNAAIEVEQVGDTVNSKRFSPSIPVAKIHDLMFKGDGKPIDSYTDIRWDPPGCLLLQTAAKVPGTDEGIGMNMLHFLTPENERSTHYMFGVARKPRPTDEDVKRQIAELRRYAFTQQDQPMIEAQQRIMDGLPEGTRQALIASIDSGPARVQRVLDRLIAEERDAGK
jgi:phenylpropionate dioxygenase-like ring-hydroxylating dioxygenase large terminal subunit